MPGTAAGPQATQQRDPALGGDGSVEIPQTPWFVFIGAQAHDLSTRFAIGADTECQPRQAGELTCSRTMSPSSIGTTEVESPSR